MFVVKCKVEFGQLPPRRVGTTVGAAPKNYLIPTEKTRGIENMTKTDLIVAVAEKTGLKKKDAEAAVSAVLSTVADTLAQGEKVTLVGFGSFEVKERAARDGRNPLTGESIKIAASKRPVFTAGKALKDQVK